MIRIQHIWFVFALFILTATVSCEKGDEYYKDYQNNTKVYDGTILKYLESQKGTYDSLLLVLDRAPGLRSKLMGTEKFTFYAMTNRSFEIAVKALNATRKLTNKAPLYLEDVDQLELDSLMGRYIFDGEVTTETLYPYIDGLKTKSVYGYDMHMYYNVSNASGFVSGGQQEIEFSDVNNSIFKRYWQTTTTTAVNLKTTNGVIHFLSASHDFGFNKFTSKFSQ
ncbi:MULTISPECIES: hypothetical protein [unclassified Sphingobacterium]|uniref:hypothetical protein n=1 Tax=unclassified Sphingobacterium TaxID=2609468 RepID=UPI0025CD094D|nr:MULTISPECIES: hypothetical protein [unclassified Sphingobacterium]